MSTSPVSVRGGLHSVISRQDNVNNTQPPAAALEHGGHWAYHFFAGDMFWAGGCKLRTMHMDQPQDGMADSGPAGGRSTPLDFDRLIGKRPDVRRAAADAASAAWAGEMVRRIRTMRGMTQAGLADRTGFTEHGISGIERGLGAGAPAARILARLIGGLAV
jgi:DNA-binding XRE family transcriptional regulator